MTRHPRCRNLPLPPTSRQPRQAHFQVSCGRYNRTPAAGGRLPRSHSTLKIAEALGAPKYCSTFDSTDRGHIGQMLNVVADELGAERVVVAPSLPANGRTVYHGPLFIGADLLEHSSMRHHRLTPMARSRVADLLRPQTPHAVAELHHETVRRGPETVRAALAGSPMVSGGSGLACGLPRPGTGAGDWQQIADAAHSQPVRRVDARAAVHEPDPEVGRIVDWVRAQATGTTPVVYATAEPADVVSELDSQVVAPAVEAVLARTARRLVGEGRSRDCSPRAARPAAP
ncbi:four-carbon acid sugar kinase family protein [Amycolatopsis magusensis]|uniref:four-carbon acid sugar kinase family protein n=1 Tax=Amycolatopsis magusensis TaxID=882444 RepID=UPI003C2C35A1